jgi:hypothetical protein
VDSLYTELPEYLASSLWPNEEMILYSRDRTSSRDLTLRYPFSGSYLVVVTSFVY